MRIFILTLFLVFPIAVWADDSGLDPKAPAQYFEQSDAQVTPASPEPSSAPAPASSAPATTTAAPADGQQSLSILQAELSQLNQNSLMFEQRITQQLFDLNDKHNQLEEQVKQLQQALSLLNQAVQQMNQTATQLQTPQNPGEEIKNSNLTNKILPTLRFLDSFWLPISGALLLVILIMLWILKRKKPSKSEDDTKDEYDYMGSAESIPAKLDLARTYMAMEDFESAAAVLHEVLEKGDADQRTHAQKLLDELPR